MDYKQVSLGLFLLKDFAPVMGVAVLASLLWWGIDPGLLWHADMAPFEAVARHWFDLDGGWAQTARWGLGLGVAILGALLLMPLGLIGFAVVAVALMGIFLSLVATLYAIVLPPLLIFVFWMWLYDALLTYALKKPGVKEYEDLSRNDWIGLLAITAISYLIVVYWLVVRFIP